MGPTAAITSKSMRKHDLTDLRFRLDSRTRPLLPDTVGVTLSTCGQYRYRLWRIWDHQLPYVLFIALSPAAGDDTTDDPIVLACQRLAVSAGYGGFHLTSLFGWRKMGQGGFFSAADPIGKDNDTILLDAAFRAGKVICAWGSDECIGKRGEAVLRLLEQAGISTHALKLNADGSPVDLFGAGQSIDSAVFL